MAQTLITKALSALTAQGMLSALTQATCSATCPEQMSHKTGDDGYSIADSSFALRISPSQPETDCTRSSRLFTTRPATCRGHPEHGGHAVAPCRHLCSPLAGNGGGAEARGPGLMCRPASLPQKHVKVRSECRGKQQRSRPCLQIHLSFGCSEVISARWPLFICNRSASFTGTSQIAAMLSAR